MAEPPFDLSQAHRWFAMGANNRAWDLVESATRSPVEVEEMLDAAHAAAWHWRLIGTPLNLVRAQNLLATAYAAANLGSEAVRHAELCLELSRSIGDEQTVFDRAGVHGCAALAYRLVGNAVTAEEQLAQAFAAVDQLADVEDRQVIDRLYLKT
jgi:hypothetical protein